MSEPRPNMTSWWSDEPIGRPSDDRFGRQGFIAHAVELVQQIGTQPSSTVIGLVGPWGSGKTSSMHLIVAGLPEGIWRVTWINPWALSGADAVITELLGAIRAALPAGGPADRAKAALARYGKYAVPALGLIPLVGGPVKDAATHAIGQAGGDGTLGERLKEAEAALRALHQPVLVVLDDLDRLQPDQLLTVFRAVRVLGRLPYVHYLAAYDHQTVIDVLCATPVASGRVDRAVAFLEKVVNLPLDQPPFRSEHAQDLLAAGISGALAAASATVTEEVAVRLGREQDAILRLLTEPRALSRLVAQLRIYLSLIGAAEVDVVDFLALTHLRLTHPVLYRALSVDRLELTTAPDREVADQLERKYSAASLRDQFHVPAAHSELIEVMLWRLFPILDSETRLGHDGGRGRKRKRDRRASDPDHVERYFALSAIAGDFSMASLTAALDELRRGVSGPASRELASVLMPNHADRTSVAAAVSALRRAETLTDDVLPVEAGRVLPFLVARLPALREPLPANGGTERAAVAWLAQLMARADQPAPDDLVAAFCTGPQEPTLLTLLIRALQPGLATLDAAGWYGAMVLSATHAAWERVLANVSLSDEALSEPVAALIQWIEDVWGADEVNRLLAQAIDDGRPMSAVAARLVEVGTTFPTNQSTMVDFDAGGFIQRLGYERVVGSRLDLGEAAEPAGAALDEDDVSWRNRRRLAARQILHVLETEERDPAALLPLAPDLEAGPFRNANTNLLSSVNPPPEAVVQVRFVLPAGHDRLLPDQREDLLATALAGSPLASWLEHETSSGSIPWRVTDGNAYGFTELTWDPGSGAAPFVVKAQVNSMLTIAVGLLAHDPPPTLQTLYMLLSAMLQSSDTAADIGRRLGGTIARDWSVDTEVTLSARDDLDKVFSLGQITRYGRAQRTQHTKTLAIGVGNVPPADATAAVLNQWLSDARYRGYAPTLYSLWRPRPANPTDPQPEPHS
ncbi:P-loop NTPase fold protein [Dactylosporangium maewongense]|uniref:P-loop NTPase fold protein n=1 Tax=Dactylosporangium maewongense TaxID=634393 RepID=UPI0031E21728